MIAKKYSSKLRAQSAENPYASPYRGLYYKKVHLGFTRRRYFVYTPENWIPQERTVFLLVPEKTSVEDFIEKSGYIELSEKHNLLIVAIEPKDGKYSSYEDEEKFIKRISTDLYLNIFREFAAPSFDGHYYIGYGAGAAIAAEFTVKNPVESSGTTIINCPQISDEIFEEAKHILIKTYSRDEGARNYCVSECPVPFLIVGEGNEKLEGYWKEINQVQDGIKVERLAVQEFSSIQNPELTEMIIDKLIHIARFAKGPLGDLHEYKTIEELGLDVFEEKIFHAGFKTEMNRCWAVYLPSYYDGKLPMPLVLATHGFTGTIGYFARNSEMCELAEKEGFIVVFSQALPNVRSRVGTPRWRSGYLNIKNPFKRADTEETLNSEINYFTRVIESVCEHYNIDESRIYCTGHSNGAEMTYSISQKMTGTFAATVQVGYSVRQYKKVEDMPFSEIGMPYLNIESEQDGGFNPDNENDPIFWELKYRLVENGMSPNQSYKEKDCDQYRTRSYYSDDEVPLVNFIMYKNACHAYFKEMSELAWDFMKQFSREKDMHWQLLNEE